MFLKTGRKNIIMRFVFGITILLSMLSIFVVAPTNIILAMSGTGISSDPYIITNVSELQDIDLNLSAYYVLGNDINASDTKNWNGNEGWTSLGEGFLGELDGGNHTITGLYQNSSSGYGMFSDIGAGAIVKNIYLVDSYIANNASQVISTFGYENRGLISNCHVINGTVISLPGGGACGGAAGFFSIMEYSGQFLNCSFNGTVEGSATSYYCAGFIFNAVDGSLDRCFFDGYVKSFYSSWGFAFGIIGSTVNNCYSTGTVEDTYLGSTEGSGFARGITLSYINNSYSSCVLIGNSIPSLDFGFCLSNVILNSCYWDINTSGQVNSGGGNGKTTTEMMQQATFAGWDFTTPIWYITEGLTYPTFLRPPTPALPDDIGTKIIYQIIPIAWGIAVLTAILAASMRSGLEGFIVAVIGIASIIIVTAICFSL